MLFRRLDKIDNIYNTTNNNNYEISENVAFKNEDVLHPTS